MKQKFFELARWLRHHPSLKSAGWLWNLLRGPAHAVLSFGNSGVLVQLAADVRIEIPADLVGTTEWESYEPETVACLKHYLSLYPEAFLVDVGSAIGIYSAAAMSLSPQCRVLACDSDLPSLKITERMCGFVSGARLQLIYGFVSNEDSELLSLDELDQKTRSAFKEQHLSGEAGSNAYVCIDGGPEDIPTHSLDNMLKDIEAEQMLIKIDVEGAELFVLQGAEKLLVEKGPNLLVSVHPDTLPNYGHSRNLVEEFLTERHYMIELIGIDHEEHWFCTKRVQE